MKKKIISKRLFRWSKYNPSLDNQTLRELVLKQGRVKDNPRQPLLVKYEDIWIDARKQVMQLLKEGKMKRVREYGYGHSGHAGHTYFVTV